MKTKLNNRLISKFFTLLLIFTAVGCNQGPSETELELKAELDRLKQERTEAIEAQQKLELQEEKTRLEEAELAEKKALEEKLKALEEKVAQAEKKVATPPTPKFGPGNMNGPNNPKEGYVKVVTNSANGKLTLRDSFSQQASAVKNYQGKSILIPNGTSDIPYYDLVKNGNHTWYYSEYGGDYGWLRGDYLSSY